MVWISNFYRSAFTQTWIMDTCSVQGEKTDVINNETTVTKEHFIVCYFIIICPFIKMKNTEQFLSLKFSKNQSEK